MVCGKEKCKMKIRGLVKQLAVENIDTPDAVCRCKMRKVMETAHFAAGSAKKTSKFPEKNLENPLIY